jgi:curved DNA-binding protein CbpA
MSVAEAAAILDIAPDADPTEIQLAFRRMIAAHHPDFGGDTESTVRILTARDTLLAGPPPHKATSDRRRTFHRRRFRRR